MRFVIVGYGRVGKRTVRVLAEEGHEVVVVDVDADAVERARQAGFEAVEGDGSAETTLDDAEIADADGVAGLTGDLNVNFAACLIGKANGCRTVLRISEDYDEQVYRKYADDVDEVIYPERLGAAGAKIALLGGDVSVVADVTEDLALSTIHVPEGSPVVGDRVIGIDLPGDARIYAHGDAREPMTIPLPKTMLRAGDRVAVVAERDALDDVREKLLGAE